MKVDDAAGLLLAHVRGGRPHHREVALEVDGDDGVPLVLAHVEDHPLAQDAGAAHEDVEVAELLQGEIDDAPCRRPWWPRSPALASAAAAALRIFVDDLIGRLAGRIAPVHADAVVVDDYRRAVRGQPQRHRAPDARAPPVTTATLPSSIPMTRSSPVRASCCGPGGGLSRRRRVR